MNYLMFGERLKLRRMARGITQGQLADMVGCGARSISHYERNVCKPPAVTFIKISDILGEF